MHRKALLETLDRYTKRHPRDADRSEEIKSFVRRREDCFLRSCLEGHITASSWVLSPDDRRFLLVHHKKLGAWLQPGGHADGDPDTAGVAVREAIEESGLGAIDLVSEEGGMVLPLDVDVHSIPATEDVGEHLHYDIRYLLRSRTDGPLHVSDESHDVRWFEWGKAESALQEESLRRMWRRARRLVGVRESSSKYTL